jgi:hypothetical protein
MTMMAQRKNVAPALINGLTSELGGPRTSQLLDRVDALASVLSRPAAPHCDSHNHLARRVAPR